MPMTVEAVIAYFGIVLAGCAVVSIADSFAAAEVASRLHIAKAVAIVTQAGHPFCPVLLGSYSTPLAAAWAELMLTHSCNSSLSSLEFEIAQESVARPLFSSFDESGAHAGFM